MNINEPNKEIKTQLFRPKFCNIENGTTFKYADIKGLKKLTDKISLESYPSGYVIIVDGPIVWIEVTEQDFYRIQKEISIEMEEVICFDVRKYEKDLTN